MISSNLNPAHRCEDSRDGLSYGSKPQKNISHE
jgi:hypothetical protein